MAEADTLAAQRWSLKVTDPITVSLGASINDEDTAFRDPLKNDRRNIFEARTLDVWESRDNCRLLERSYPLSRRLPESLFDADHPEAESHERLALRLLITRPSSTPDYGPNHHDFEREDERQINYLPFIPDAIEDLIVNYRLPREWTYLRLNAREVGNFTRKTDWDFSVTPAKARGMGFVIHFPFVLLPAKLEEYITKMKGKVPAGRRTLRSVYDPLRDDPFIWSLAMSHSLRDGKTRGILDGITDQAFSDISGRMLENEAPWYEHPLHIPSMLLDIFFEHSAWEVNRMCTDVGGFEVLSRDARVSNLDKFDVITSELQDLRRNLSFQQSLAKFLLETLKFLEEKIFAREDGQEPSGYLMHMYETNPRREEKLNNVLHLIENNLETCTYLQSRTKDALEYINGAIRFQDNEANQADADSNRTMTFLQMTFLPATAVAAVMSMSAFDFDNNPVSIKPSFWIFWVFAILLTVIVLSTYYIITIRARNKQKQKDADAAAREEAEDGDDEDTKQASNSPPIEEAASPPRRRRRHRSRGDEKYRHSRSRSKSEMV